MQERASGIKLAAARDGAEGHNTTISCASWMVVARRVLLLMTGWSLPEDIIDYAARALRVRSMIEETMTSGQLDELLAMYEWAHAQASRGGPWMSSEYAAVLD